jgi:hypothetical protein
LGEDMWRKRIHRERSIPILEGGKSKGKDGKGKEKSESNKTRRKGGTSIQGVIARGNRSKDSSENKRRRSEMVQPNIRSAKTSLGQVPEPG